MVEILDGNMYTTFETNVHKYHEYQIFWTNIWKTLLDYTKNIL